MSSIECAKQQAGQAAVDDWLKSGQVVGIGSGTTVKYVVEAIARKTASNGFKVKCVPTSFQAKELIIENNLDMTSLEVHQTLDVAFDGADEVCEDLTLIKGGGGCLLQEKIVAACAKNLIILVDDRKCSQKLGSKWTKGLPIEVIPMAYKPVQSWIEKQFGGEAILRPAGTKMGPQLTDNCNFLLDWHFDTNRQYNWPEVEAALLHMPGVVDTGLFIGMTKKVYIGKSDGSVETWPKSA